MTNSPTNQPRPRHLPLILTLTAIPLIILCIPLYLIIPTGTEAKLIGTWTTSYQLNPNEPHAISHTWFQFNANGTVRTVQLLNAGSNNTDTNTSYTQSESTEWWIVNNNQLHAEPNTGRPAWLNRLIHRFTTPQGGFDYVAVNLLDNNTFTLTPPGPSITFQRYEGTHKDWLDEHTTPNP